MKILINNEEVVCNHEITITEEMLTTSSTILNNCYPKSWETDHDYISRFYYPKDYSKCLIYDKYNYIPGQQGTTATGTDITIDYDNTKEWKLQKLYGDTFQQTYSGKNLFDGTYIAYAIGGNSGHRFFSASGSKTAVIPCQPNTTYTITKFETSNRFNICDYPSYPTTATEINQLAKNEGASTLTVTTHSDANYLFVYISNNNVEPQMQIEKGSSSTSFEPYVGGTPSPNPSYPQEIQNVTGRQVVEINEQQYEINLGKNLFNINDDYVILSRVTILKNNTTITVTSTQTNANNYAAFLFGKDEVLGKTFTVHCNMTGTTGGIRFYYGNAQNNPTSSISGAYYPNDDKFTFTVANQFPSGSDRLLILFYSNFSSSDIGTSMSFENVQVEKGSVATTYSPYFTPIELCKIGDNQDFIDGDIDNWYINKYIDKINIDTSQITLRSNYTNIEYAIIQKPTNYLGYDVFDHTEIKCSHGIWISSQTSGWDSIDNIGKISGNAAKLNWWLGFEKGTGLTVIKQKLENCKIYYPLATLTRTKITNTELVNQLNALAQANLLNGYNNIIVNSENLPTSLQIYYNYIEPYYDTKLLFSGVVKNTGNMSLNPREPHYASLQVLDFKTMLSEGDILGFVISNKTVPEAIQMVVEAISNYGVVVGNINILNPDEIIGAYSTVDKTAYDVLQYLAEISQAKWTTRLIDENTIAIDFYDPTLMPQAEDLEYTKQYFEENNIESIEYSYGTYDYRNKQIMTSDQVYGSIDYVETILADGYNRTFNVTTNIGLIKSIYVDGVSKTFGTNDDKEIGIEYDFYYKIGQTQIESNSNNPIYSSNSSIVITYTPLVKGRQIIYNNDEVNRINQQTSRNGVISRYENRNDVLSNDELTSIGQTYIKYKGSAEINLIVKTYNIDLYNVGQLVYFNAPLDELKKTYMVKQKEITRYVANSQEILFCKYTLTSSFNSEREVNYFDNQRNKAKGNISAGEYVTRNVDIENSVNIIFNNLQIEEIQTGNVLNSILNSPLSN